MEIFQKDKNAQHFTRDKLICSFCGKNTETVLQACEKLACFKAPRMCWIELLESSLLTNKQEYIKVRTVTDILFDKRKETRKQERSKMTLKLRFAILERDNFACVVCGRQPPLVTLEVDHIDRVSNGGKSTPSNLRTLCFDCNHGRG